MSNTYKVARKIDITVHKSSLANVYENDTKQGSRKQSEKNNFYYTEASVFKMRGVECVFFFRFISSACWPPKLIEILAMTPEFVGQLPPLSFDWMWQLLLLGISFAHWPNRGDAESRRSVKTHTLTAFYTLKPLKVGKIGYMVIANACNRQT